MSSPAVATSSKRDLNGKARSSGCHSSSDLYDRARSAYENMRENDPESWEEVNSVKEDMEGTLADGGI